MLTVFNEWPLKPVTTDGIFVAEFQDDKSVPSGEKNDEKQQTHIIRAIEKRPIFPGLLPLLSVVFLSNTKLTS